MQFEHVLQSVGFPRQDFIVSEAHKRDRAVFSSVHVSPRHQHRVHLRGRKERRMNRENHFVLEIIIHQSTLLHQM